MRVLQTKHNGIKFQYREGTSDIKSFKEVVVRDVYQRRYFKIKEGDHWLDLGGNVGAFALLVLSKGATVEIYEPDPFSCKMIENNLKLNNWDAEINQMAVIAGKRKRMNMYVGNNQNVWRNSLYRDWGNEKFSVDCINYENVITDKSLVKMDIEGAEMGILEKMKAYPQKMVFEWSFDIDKSLTRYRELVEKLKDHYSEVRATNFDESYVLWQDSWFPPCTNVYCFD